MLCQKLTESTPCYSSFTEFCPVCPPVCLIPLHQSKKIDVSTFLLTLLPPLDLDCAIAVQLLPFIVERHLRQSSVVNTSAPDSFENPLPEFEKELPAANLDPSSFDALEAENQISTSQNILESQFACSNVAPPATTEDPSRQLSESLTSTTENHEPHALIPIAKKSSPIEDPITLKPQTTTICEDNSDSTSSAISSNSLHLQKTVPLCERALTFWARLMPRKKVANEERDGRDIVCAEGKKEYKLECGKVEFEISLVEQGNQRLRIFLEELTG
ncbi:hypothetical protein HK098_003653 [Nowakowskiella sp. JEL0407]|nr:hypothetical protein HK098_003653 [Nowakowskiella sp. JEL0407]